jgi:hypothetical protein
MESRHILFFLWFFNEDFAGDDSGGVVNQAAIEPGMEGLGAFCGNISEFDFANDVVVVVRILLISGIGFILGILFVGEEVEAGFVFISMVSIGSFVVGFEQVVTGIGDPGIGLVLEEFAGAAGHGVEGLEFPVGRFPEDLVAFALFMGIGVLGDGVQAHWLFFLFLDEDFAGDDSGGSVVFFVGPEFLDTFGGDVPVFDFPDGVLEAVLFISDAAFHLGVFFISEKVESGFIGLLGFRIEDTRTGVSDPGIGGELIKFSVSGDETVKGAEFPVVQFPEDFVAFPLLGGIGVLGDVIEAHSGYSLSSTKISLATTTGAVTQM